MQLLFLIASLLSISCASTQDYSIVYKKWEGYKTPTQGPSESIGSYSAGCVAGTRSLKTKGEGYVTVRRSRNRFHGHSSLIRYLESYSQKINSELKGSIAIGDLSQIRGGPMRSGHKSHQSGLDVDIWFNLLNENQYKNWTERDAEDFLPIEVTDSNFKSLNSNWSKKHIQMLKIAALDDRVERIFVNARIKEQLCKNFSNEKWIIKIRPWWAHHDHFHVRLKCPAMSKDCIPQSAPETKDCGEQLNWWLSNEAFDKFTKKTADSPPPKLPQRCSEI